MTDDADDPVDVEQLLPDLDAIEDDSLRAGVREAWARAFAETSATPALPWLPPGRRDEYAGEVALLAHVRDVTALAVALAEQFVERGYTVDLDTVLAGALVHDVSKPYEFDADRETALADRLPHPHYGVHLAARVGLPLDVQHVVVSHSRRSAVEPATVEAVVVAHADELVSTATRMGAGSPGP